MKNLFKTLMLVVPLSLFSVACGAEQPAEQHDMNAVESETMVDEAVEATDEAMEEVTEAVDEIVDEAEAMSDELVEGLDEMTEDSEEMTDETMEDTMESDMMDEAEEVDTIQ